jgi:hypothetical protein
MGSSPREHGKREFSARLASASVCFPSFKRASVTRSDLIGYKLLTIHSFMNLEFILVFPQHPFSFISPVAIGIFATLYDACGHISSSTWADCLWTLARWSHSPGTSKPLGLSKRICSCYLEVSVEEGKLAKRWCVTV